MSQAKVTINAIIHATEDSKKLYDSFERVLGAAPGTFAIQDTTGHYGNPITLLDAKLTRGDAVRLIDRLVKSMPAGMCDGIIDELDELVSKSGLHLRFDKQEFVGGRLVPGEASAIKIRIYTPVYDKKNTAESYTELLDGT